MKLVSSLDKKQRLVGVQLLAENMWSPEEIQTLRAKLDHRTLIGLSRIRGADSRFFIPPSFSGDGSKVGRIFLVSNLLRWSMVKNVNELFVGINNTKM
jgi:hypothetical protein